MQNRIFLSRQLADGSEINVEQLSNQINTLQNMSSKQLQLSHRSRHRQKDLYIGSLYNSKQSNLNNNKYAQQSSIFSKNSHKMQTDESIRNLFRSKNIARQNKNQSKNNIFLINRRKNWLQLKQVVKHQKVQGLIQLFIQKLKRNNPYSPPIDHHLPDDSQSNFLDRRGLQLKQSAEKVINIICIMNIITSIFIYSLGVVFQQINSSFFMQLTKIVGGVVFCLQIMMNLTTIRFSQGRKRYTLRQIAKDYMQHKFYIDLLNFIAVLININTASSIVNPLNLIVILKLSDYTEKLQKLEVFFIENYYNQQYWSLVKVFIFNFGFAHFLAIIMIGMAQINTQDNWMVAKRIDYSQWFEKYTWAYYWATTMMLTIGYGDIVPTTYQQALCMIFLQTISCIVLAYNINCVGALVANIRSQDIEKSKSLKIFKKLADKHKISDDLTWKVNNHIEQFTNIHKMFNVQQQAQFVQKLPHSFRIDYLKQANKVLFQKLFFFSHMMQKTLFALAEVIEVRITHPEQLILTPQTNFNLIILKKGQMGYMPRLTDRSYSKFVFDKVALGDSDQPFLLHTNFITKKRAKYAIKSILYSVVYELDFESLIDTLKQHKLDYELYCQMKDKSSYKLDEFQVFICQYCKTKHTKFSCPKLHYLPLHQHVIHRQIAKQNKGKNTRKSSFKRPMISHKSCLAHYVFNKEIYAKREQQRQYMQAANKRIKKQKLLLEGLKVVENEREQTFLQQKTIRNRQQIEDLVKVQSKFMENTAEVIKMYITKAFGVETGEDQLWIVDLDRMKNYRDYFQVDNPCNLEKKFDLEQRLAVLAQKQSQQAVIKAFVSQSPSISQKSFQNSAKRLIPEPAEQFDQINARNTSLMQTLQMQMIRR